MKHIHPIIKLVIVTVLATYISYLLGITNYLTAGIVAMISIQKTKKQSINIAFKRTILVLISIVLASVLFVLVGYNLIAYSIVILMVVILSFQLTIQEGTIPSVVIVTHLLVFGAFSLAFTLETLLMYTISIVIAVLFNFFYPSESTIELEKYRDELDSTIRAHIEYLINKITTKEPTCNYTRELEMKIEHILENINQITGDMIMKNHQDILLYSNMRSKQFDILKNICAQSDKLVSQYPQTNRVLSYLEELVDDIGIRDHATKQNVQIRVLIEDFKEEPLPKTREEFEHRAILYYIVLEIRQFLQLKIDYHAQE